MKYVYVVKNWCPNQKIYHLDYWNLGTEIVAILQGAIVKWIVAHQMAY